MITKYFCARYWLSSTITRYDFAKITPAGYGITEGGSKRALETGDYVSFNTWADARLHLLNNAKREMENAKTTMRMLKRMKDPSK